MSLALAPSSSLLTGSDSTAAVVTSDGTPWTWDDLYTKYAPMIRSYARSKGLHQPDDIIQEVFTALVQSLSGFQGDESGLRSLIFTVAYRRIADDHRRIYRNRETLVAEHHPAAAPTATIEDTVTTRQSAHEALKAFDILSQRERQVLELRLLHDASPSEVAATLGLTSVNVRVVQARALAKVRDHLLAKNGGEPLLGAGLVFATARNLFTDWSNDPSITQWTRQLHRDGLRSNMVVDHPAHAVNSTTPTIAETSHTTLQSLVQTLVQHGATGIVAVVSVVALSTAGTTPSTESLTPLLAPSSQVSQTLTVVLNDDTPATTESTASTLPTTSPEQSGATNTPAETHNDEAVGGQDDSSPDAPALEPVESDDSGLVAPLVDQTVGLLTGTLDALTTGLVDPLVDTVVDPLLEGVVDIVVKVTDPLIVDVVDPLVDEVVEVTNVVQNLLNGLLTP